MKFTKQQQQPGVLKQFAFSREEEWRKSSCDQSKSSEQLHSLRAVQNGTFTQLEIPPLRKGFSLQDRFKICIFCNSTSQVVKEICEVYMVWQSKRVSLPVFWSLPVSKDLHKTFHGSNSSFMQNQYMSNDIS